MRLIETDTNANKDINAAVAVGAYTATTTRGVIVRLLADQVAGGGDYIAYVTVQLAGAGSHYRIIPLTTGTAAAALTAIGFVSIPIPVDTGDVLTVYIDGLAGDTTTPDVRVDFYEQDYLRPTTAGRTLDVSAGGEAGVDWANVGSPTSTVALTGTSLNSVSGSVGSVSGLTAADVNAIKVVTDKLNTAMVLDGAVYQFTANALELAASGGLNAAETGDAVLDEVVEGSYTLRQMMRLIAATLAGVSSGGGTAGIVFTGLDGATQRIVATVDALGNRTAVTKTVT